MTPLYTFENSKLHSLLLQWYDQARRTFPWRATPGTAPNVYHIWLSEIMLQQTTTAAVVPYFHKFIERWPTLEALAGASLDEILHTWQGLGYYARARNLQRCAQILVKDYAGCFPSTAQALKALPGIGAYTSAAIAAIAFGERVVPIDGNVVRVASRLFGIETPYPQSMTLIQTTLGALGSSERPGDFAQALMDLGSQVCLPKTPVCEHCPLAEHCEGYKRNIADRLPVKQKAQPLPTRYAYIFWLVDREDRSVLIQRREESGLLGGLFEFPSTPWQKQKISLEEAKTMAPLITRWALVPGAIHHTFTHFHLELRALKGAVKRADCDSSLLWCPPTAFAQYAFPTAMKKVITHIATRSKRG